MPTLPDPKREAFAQHLARGLPTVDAYTRAGYKRNTGNATTLKKKPDIVARVEELRDAMNATAGADLAEYLRDTKLSAAHIVKMLKETAENAGKAGKYDIAARCWKDIGSELFGMFVERKHIAVDKQSVHSETNTTINIADLNQALEALGGPSQKFTQIDGFAEVLDATADLVPPEYLKIEQ